MTGFAVCWASFVIQAHGAVKATSVHVCPLRVSLPMGLQSAILLAVGCTGPSALGSLGFRSKAPLSYKGVLYQPPPPCKLCGATDFKAGSLAVSSSLISPGRPLSSKPSRGEADAEWLGHLHGAVGWPF